MLTVTGALLGGRLLVLASQMVSLSWPAAFVVDEGLGIGHERNDRAVNFRQEKSLGHAGTGIDPVARAHDRILFRVEDHLLGPLARFPSVRRPL